MAQYWYLWLVFAALVCLTAVVMFFAGRALSLHNAETKKYISELERLTELKQKYQHLTAQKAEKADSKELLDGVTAVLQARIEKAENDETEFACFNEVQKNAYILKFFIDDAQESLSAYFDDFTQNFARLLLIALKAVGADDILALAQRELEMIDENNEDVSFDRELLKEIDKEFLSVYSEKELLDKIKIYIKNNIDKF